MREAKYPPGWDAERVRRVLEHYEHQTDEDAMVEDEAAHERKTSTFMEVPNELVPLVQEMITKHESH